VGNDVEFNAMIETPMPAYLHIEASSSWQSRMDD